MTDPFFSNYLALMRSTVGGRLPRFTTKEVSLLKGLLDYMGLNYYTTFYRRMTIPLSFSTGRMISRQITNQSASVSNVFSQHSKPKLVLMCVSGICIFSIQKLEVNWS